MTGLMLALVSLCEASPALFHTSAESAVSDTQRVLYEQIGGGTHAEYEVIYDGDATSFGWMIPVFGRLIEVTDREDGHLETLLRQSEPVVEYVSADPLDTGDGADGGGPSCGCAGTKNDEYSISEPGAKDDTSDSGDDGDTASAADLSSVDVVATGFTGTYTWQLIETETADDLVTWLSDNGWDEGDQRDVIESYVAEGGVTWLCVKLAVDASGAETEETGRSLPVLGVSWEGDTMRYPAILAKNGEATSLRTTLLVVGESDATISSGWKVTTVGSLVGEDLPADAFTGYLEALSATEATYGLTYAGDYDDQRLTRLDTLTAAALHTADVEISFTGDATDVVTTIEVETSSTRRVSGAAALGLAAMLGVTLRRRSPAAGRPG